jgi:hypothetical protein
MFGFGSNEKLIAQMAGTINGAATSFDQAIAATAALSRQEIPPFGDRYLAILLGFADAIGQSAKADMKMTTEALKRYFGQHPDGHTFFDRTMALSKDSRYFKWTLLGGRALYQATTNDKTTAMMQLAKAYFAK